MPLPAAVAALAPLLGPAVVAALPSVAGALGNLIGKSIKPGTSKLASDIQFSAPSGEGLRQDPAANVTSGLLDKDLGPRMSRLGSGVVAAADTGIRAQRDLRRATSGEAALSAIRRADVRRRRNRERFRFGPPKRTS